MREIKYFIKFQLAIILLTKSVINCTPNCSSDDTKVFIQNNNFSMPIAKVRDLNETIEAVINSVTYNDSNLAYNVAPQISSYERGNDHVFRLIDVLLSKSLA